MKVHALAERINTFMNTYCARDHKLSDAQYITNIENCILSGDTRILEQAIESGVRRNPSCAIKANTLLNELRKISF